MKKTIFILFAILVSLNTYAQPVLPCENFNAISNGPFVVPPPPAWNFVLCNPTFPWVVTTNTLDATKALMVQDGAGDSRIENNIDYNNLGTLHLGKNLAFDYKVFNDSRPTTMTLHPAIYLEDAAGKQIAFVGSVTITESTDWVHVCAPIELFDQGHNKCPDNIDGEWVNLTGGSFLDFDNVMKHNVKIFFDMDFGSSHPSEVIGIDNICVTTCQLPAPGPCKADFSMSLTYSSDPAAVANRAGNIFVSKRNAGSYYMYDWGDGFITTDPFNHIYTTSGTYNVCVTEIRPDGTSCYACVKLCVMDPIDHGFFAPLPTDTNKCDPNFLFVWRVGTDLGLPNGFGEIIVSDLKDNIYSSYFHTYKPGLATYANLGSIHYLPGTYKICVKEMMKKGDTCETCLNICVTDPMVTSKIKEEFEDKTEFKLYPNPSDNETQLSFSLKEKETLSIAVVDVLGKVVLEFPKSQYSAGKNTITINTGLLMPGLYSISIKSENKVRYEKLSVTR